MIQFFKEECKTKKLMVRRADWALPSSVVLMKTLVFEFLVRKAVDEKPVNYRTLVTPATLPSLY